MSACGGPGDLQTDELGASDHELTLGTPTPVGAPGEPRLSSPAEGYLVRDVHMTTTTDFAWDPPKSGPTPNYYLFHFSDADDIHGYKSTPIKIHYTAPARININLVIPSQLSNKRGRWSVRACVNTSPGTLLSTASCGPTASRTLTVTTTPEAPQLLSPAAGSRITDDATFSWSSSTGAASYLLCVAKPNVACPAAPVSRDDVLAVAGGGTTRRVDLRRFLGQNVNWTVAACDSNGSCEYQQAIRSVRVDREPASLVTPAAGATVVSMPEMTWAGVSWADFYLVCVARPGTPCPTAPVAPATNPDLVVVKATGTRVAPSVGPSYSLATVPSIDLYQFKHQTVTWTVGACIAAYAGGPALYCSYQNTRTLTVQPEWQVSVKLQKLSVYNDCDAVSPGDWRVRVAALASRKIGASMVPTRTDHEDFPTSNGKGSRNVSTGSDLVVDRTVGFRMLESETLTLTAAAVDCDNDGLWTLANVFDGWIGIVNTVNNWMQTCGGEEFWEGSGKNDLVGTVLLTLTPTQWIGLNNTSYALLSPGGHDCGKNPYRAYFVVTTRRF